MNKLQRLLEQSNELPSLPEIYLRVSELLESENATAHQIGEAVQTDLSLTTKLLKMINSAYYGLPKQVTSISQAVSLLGRQRLKEVLMGSVLSVVFSDLEIANFSMRDFWRHSIKTAIIARHLAMQNVNIIDHEAFFTAGLLHDTGRLILAKAEPEIVAEIDELVKTEGRDVVELETEKLGVTHIQVGVALMKKWDLPSVLMLCVAKHHETEHEGTYAIDTSIVYLANLLSQHDLDNEEEDMQAILSTIPNWQQTECSLGQVTVACQLADEQWVEVMQSLGMGDMEISDEANDEYDFNSDLGRFV